MVIGLKKPNPIAVQKQLTEKNTTNPPPALKPKPVEATGLFTGEQKEKILKNKVAFSKNIQTNQICLEVLESGIKLSSVIPTLIKQYCENKGIKEQDFRSRCNATKIALYDLPKLEEQSKNHFKCIRLQLCEKASKFRDSINVSCTECIMLLKFNYHPAFIKMIQDHDLTIPTDGESAWSVHDKIKNETDYEAFGTIDFTNISKPKETMKGNVINR